MSKMNSQALIQKAKKTKIVVGTLPGAEERMKLGFQRGSQALQSPIPEAGTSKAINPL